MVVGRLEWGIVDIQLQHSVRTSVLKRLLTYPSQLQHLNLLQILLAVFYIFLPPLLDGSVILHFLSALLFSS
jgi:hypothetical protein